MQYYEYFLIYAFFIKKKFITTCISTSIFSNKSPHHARKTTVADRFFVVFRVLSNYPSLGKSCISRSFGEPSMVNLTRVPTR